MGEGDGDGVGVGVDVGLGLGEGEGDGVGTTAARLTVRIFESPALLVEPPVNLRSLRS
jgi:hypothetical protein